MKLSPLLCAAFCLAAPLAHAQMPDTRVPPSNRGIHFVYLVRHGIYDRDSTVNDDRVGYSSQGPAMPRVFGLNQGVFRVRVDARSGRRLVTVPIVTARTSAPEIVVRGDRSRRPLPLAQFVAQVKSAIQAGAR